jgi:hypothetical protein
MTKKMRPKLSKSLEKRVFQEAASRCGFCSESDIASLQIHHIDGNPTHNEMENLLCVCANCHSKITAGVLSEAEVRATKRELHRNSQSARKSSAMAVSVIGSTVHGDIAHTIHKTYTKISTPMPPRTQHPAASIGADLKKKAYVHYLVARYYKFRSADRSYGRTVRFSHSVIHQNIENRFGYQTYFMPVDQFPRLIQYLQDAIDDTIQGRRNRANSTRNYHSFHEHFERPNKSRGQHEV